MGETVNRAEIAEKLCRDIFKTFHWEIHRHTNDNFDCVHEHHKRSDGSSKRQHPGDVIFHYQDPYLDKRIYLHTDLKSYQKGTMRRDKLKDALESLAWTTECANASEQWRKRYCVDESENFEVRGLLFVANHDGKAPHEFDGYYAKINRQAIPLAPEQTIYVLSPRRITSLYSVATDIKLLASDHLLPPRYHFHYPDLTMWKRQVADDTRVAATVESLMSPFFVLKHGALAAGDEHNRLEAGNVVYYSRPGDTSAEFVYLLDGLSRWQLLDARSQTRVRVFAEEPSDNLRNNFEQAKRKYCNMWRFGDERAQEILSISIDTVQRNNHNYTPAKIGWKE